MVSFLHLGRHGRLGNQLFQIASTIGVAINNGHPWSFPPWRNYDNLTVGGNSDIEVQPYFPIQLPLVEHNLDFQVLEVPWGFHNIELGPGNFALYGYLQSEKYFKHCESLIRAYLTPKPLVDIKLGKGTCAVHVRLGDYDYEYHPRQTAEYYLNAMSKVPEGTRFIVFSDEPEKAEAILGSDHLYARGNHHMVDFYLMTTAEHNIIGNSSFSWWAAWLNPNPDKQVIAPSNWFGPKKQLSTEDIYCPEWIVAD